MIRFITGNLLESSAEAFVNTVNTVGIMGKGIALQFKNQFPLNFKIYAKACKENKFNIGQLLITEELSLIHGHKVIINFPTKTDWRKPSELSYIEKGLELLSKEIKVRKIKSIALPPLGAGNGGLNWADVKSLMVRYLHELDCEILIYEPNEQIIEILKNERVKLTPARAMLLAVLYDLVKEGEFVSELSAEKITYFLQKFGAQSEFNLEFKAQLYGPYSGKVRHVLFHLNGSYISGYGSKDTKAFQEIEIKLNTEKEVIEYLNLNEHKKYLKIVQLTKQNLSGFYSNFALELLSSIDYIMVTKGIHEFSQVFSYLQSWNDRKNFLFSNERHFKIAFDKVNEFNSNILNSKFIH